MHHSHSTMYLLKLFAGYMLIDVCRQFTFHHVSIKTKTEPDQGEVQGDSHSTMYLLKPGK